jgi:type III pantothenate kinase
VTPRVVVDVGNTRIKCGLCVGDRVVAMASLPPDEPGAWQECLSSWASAGLSAAGGHWVVSGVHPARLDAFVTWLKKQTQPTRADERIATPAPASSPASLTVISSRHQIPLDVGVDFPDKVGLDRLFNAVAVNERRAAGRGAVIVDAGSAVTVDYVDEEGRFRGGAILPGLRLMAQALHAYTAKLPVVEVQRRLRPPETSTERAIELGVFHAVLGGIELLIRDLAARSGETHVASLPVFFGGGDAAVVAPHLARPATIWPEMTLEGIRVAATRRANPDAGEPRAKAE